MSWWAVLGLNFGLLVLLFLTGLPVFVCFLVILAGALFVLFGPAAFGMFANSIYDTATTDSLTTIAMFILMGEILFRCGSVDALLRAADKLVGKLAGRQFIILMILSTILGALAGSGIAVAAMLGRSMLPGMIARGYNRGLSAGSILAGALLGPIIPPSIVAIIIGTLADVSIAALLISGTIPGIILAFMYLGTALIKVRLNPSLAPRETPAPVSLGEWLRASWELVPFTVMLFFVIGLIMLGVATPSESAAAGIVAAILTAAYYRTLSLRMLWESVAESAALTAIIMIIMACSILFGQILAFTGATKELGEIAQNLTLNRWVVFAIMMLIPFVLCMFVDQVGLMMVLIPIYTPVIKILGFDPVWFWMQFLINMTLGAITPPFGYILFALNAAVPSVTLAEIYRSAWLFVWVTLLGMVLFTIFPGLITWFPSLF